MAADKSEVPKVTLNPTTLPRNLILGHLWALMVHCSMHLHASVRSSVAGNVCVLQCSRSRTIRQADDVRPMKASLQRAP
eukprot:2538674-Amphidinium_carterae.1